MSTATATAAPEASPAVNALVRVSLGRPAAASAADPTAGHWAQSRVEDVVLDPATGVPRLLALAAPRGEDGESPSRAGGPCAVQWLTPRGVCTLNGVVLGEAAAAGGLVLWQVEVTGPVQRVDRRQYVRAPWTLEAELVLEHHAGGRDCARCTELERAEGPVSALGALPREYLATTLNVSEGGLLCRMPHPAIPGSHPVLVRLTLDRIRVETPALVVWSLERIPPLAAEQGPGREVAVESAISFDDPDHYGDALRPLIYRAQLQARRDGLI